MTNYRGLSFVTLSIALFLQGCSNTPIQDTPSRPAAKPTIEQLLEQAALKKGFESALIRLQVIESLLQSGQHSRALDISRRIDLQGLPPEMQLHLSELRAQAALSMSLYAEALSSISQIEPLLASAPIARQISLITLKAEILEQQGDSFSAALLLIDMPSDNAQPAPFEINERIWQLLKKSDPQQLADYKERSSNSYALQGWLELQLSLQKADSLDQFQLLITEWKLLWESHPANLYPPSSMQVTTVARLTPQNLAIYLPQTGKLQKAAQAVTEGIIAAYLSDATSRKQTKLSFIDSTEVVTPTHLLQKLVAVQADAMIGPLEKERVNELLNQQQWMIPTLLLNYADLAPPQSNNSHSIFQFGLAIDDEAVQLAELVWSKGHKKALIIFPESSWGGRFAEKFTMHYQTLGGELVNQAILGGSEQFSEKIGVAMATTASSNRAKMIKQRIGEPVEFETRRRADVEVIILAAPPESARQLKPILDYHFAGDLPIYASSHIYSGKQNSTADRDLNNIYFVETPWLLKPSTAQKFTFSRFRDNTQTRFGRLYALGIDAYQIFPYLAQLLSLPSASISGETGRIKATHNGVLVRESSLARFIDGTPKLLDTP